MTRPPAIPSGSAQSALTRGGHRLPAASPIAGACRRAAALALAEPEVTPGGVRVRLSSPGHAGRALRALHALGYQAAGEPGGAVIVTGWNDCLLAARAVRLEVTVNGAARDPAAWASAAIARFRELVDGGAAGEAAVAGVVGEARVTALEPCLSRHHVPAPVDDEDRRRARGRVRDLLDQVSEAEAAAEALAGHVERVCEAAVRLFLAERDLRGQEEPAAAAAAASKAAEMHGPLPGGHLSVIDPATGRVRVLEQMCGTCVTRRGNPFGPDAEKVIRRNLDADALLTCHSTLPWGPYPGAEPAVCAGFWARHGRDVAAGRLALELGITRVPAPSPRARRRDPDPELA